MTRLDREHTTTRRADTTLVDGHGARHGRAAHQAAPHLFSLVQSIYGPEYTRSEQVNRLRGRKLGHKRSLAPREFALSAEALERFARGEPLYRVHECVFGVLALESEPVDPRL